MCQQTTAPVECTALNECHVAGTCNTFTGICSNPSQSDDTICSDDNDDCNGISTCQTGVCQQTTAPVECTALNECHLAGVCDPSDGSCSDPNQLDNTVCADDNNDCNGVSTCQSGVCQQTTAPVVCTALDACHRAGICNTETGVCTEPIQDNETDCDDGNLCNGVDWCQGGVCEQNLPPVACTALDQCHVAGTCNTSTGLCDNPNQTDGTTCDDSDACTDPDTCTSGVCEGTAVVCDDDDPCTADSCVSPTGCTTNPVPDCIPCTTVDDCIPDDDGDLCNGTLTCLDNDDQVCNGCAHGACVSDPATIVQCTQNPAECTETVCVPDSGICVDRSLLDGTPCDDSSACTENDVCGAGTCAGATIDCDDGNLCTDESCDLGSGCQHVDNNVTCDDGDPCTQNDTCVGGVCTGYADPTCACNEDADCQPFEDGDLCNGTLVCLVNQCLVDPATVVTCPADPVCRQYECLPDFGACQILELVDGTGCDDGNACTENDTCAGGACTGGAPVTCFDQDICTDEACDTNLGCVFTYNTADCDDGNACTETDRCDLGVCRGIPVPSCTCTSNADCLVYDDGDQCNGVPICVEHTCVTDSSAVVNCPMPAPDSCDFTQCNPATGDCDTSQLADGRQCDDGDPCTDADQCLSGVCAGTALCNVDGDCDDSDVCTSDTCTPEGCCSHAYNTASCDDGDVCTDDDTCHEGVCIGSLTCAGNCAPVITVDCGFSDVWDILNVGATDQVTSYDCPNGTFTGLRPEYAYRFVPPYDVLATVDLYPESPGDDAVAVMILSDDNAGCDGQNCIAQSYDQAQVNLAGGQTYYIVVDGEDESLTSAGGYSISVTCQPLHEEICDDGIDDDGDSLTDCDDGDCAFTAACPVPHCVVDWTLVCGYGDTWYNYGQGSTNLVDEYDCAAGVWDLPEYTYQFEAQVDGLHTVTLSQMTGDLDIFVIESLALACLPENCLAHGDNVATFTAVAGTTYFFVVDGHAGQNSNFTIDVECPCVPQCEAWWACGDDGCGGTCGAGCSGTEVCVDGGCYEPICPCDPSIVQTVCGVDDVDYANDVCAACAICEEEIPWCIGCSGDRDCNQTQPLDPVVGYLNQLASCDVCICDNDDECPVLSVPTPCDDQQLCSDQYITYDSPCEMKEAYGCTAGYESHLFSYGACICPACSGDPLDPKVCSNTGVTYPNGCTLMTCYITFGETAAHLGACLNEWFCPECSDDTVYPIDTVCGADGVTYANSCAATHEDCGNTTVASPGACGG